MTDRQQHIEDLNKITIKYGSRFLSIISKDYRNAAKQVLEQDYNIQVNTQAYAYNLYKLYLTIGVDKTIEEHNKLVRTKAQQDEMIYEWLIFLKGYADKTLADRITKIPETTKDEIRKIIESGMADGKGYKEIAKDIRTESSGEFSKYRSLLIARTEGNNAVNAGAYIAARASGLVMNKSWLHAGHSKRENRPEHVRLSKLEPIAMNDYYNVNGKQMLFPGDPAGGAGENCNCRCICSYRPVRDALGNAIALNRRSYELTSIQRTVRTALIQQLLISIFGGLIGELFGD
jgi:hypothetical protein